MRVPPILAVTLLFAALGVAEGRQLPPEEERQPIQELINTEVVYPQEQGEFQLTVRSTADRLRGGSVLAFPLQMEFGLTDAWQVELEWRTFSRVRVGDAVSSGRGAVSLGTKYSFMNIGGSPFHAAAGLEVDLPGGLGADGSREDAHEVEPFLALALDLRDDVQVFFHTGKSFTAGGSPAEESEPSPESAASVQWNAGALVALGLATVALEFNTHTAGSPWRQGDDLRATPSITFLLPRPWEVGVGVPIGLGGGSARVGVAVLLVYEK